MDRWTFETPENSIVIEVIPWVKYSSLCDVYPTAVGNSSQNGNRNSMLKPNEKRSCFSLRWPPILLIMNNLSHRQNHKQNQRPKVKTIGHILLRILVAIAIALIIFPVLLLSTTTSVPPSIQILFAMGEVAWLVTISRFGFTVRVVLVEVAGFVAITLLAIFAPQIFASTPPILDAQGQAIPNSIAVMEKVKLGGAEEWMTIRGKDSRNPVLLFLAGGPGGTQLVTARRALTRLEDRFVVVNWEQPGAGKSFDAIDRSKLTPDRYITDAHELVLNLRQRFGKEKVYVLGESWGSALGIMVVQRYPELFQAFIGTGQMVAFLENDRICYDFALRLAQERGDTNQVEKLKQQGPPIPTRLSMS